MNPTILPARKRKMPFAIPISLVKIWYNYDLNFPRMEISFTMVQIPFETIW